MRDNKLYIMMDQFEIKETGEKIPGVTVLIQGQFEDMLDLAIERLGYEDYTTLLKDAIFTGLSDLMKQSPQEQEQT